DGRRAEDRGRRLPAEDLEQLAIVAGALRVPRGLVPGGVGVGDVPGQPGDRRAQAPRAALAALVVVARQRIERRIGDVRGGLDLAARLGLQPDQLTLHARKRLDVL